MNSKDQIRETVDFLTRTTGLSQKELAIDMGYSETYISEVLSPTGRVTDKFQKSLDSYKKQLGLKQKAPNVPDVDAFMATEIIKIEAILAVIVEVLAEQEAARMNVPVTKMISAFDKAIQDKEQLMRAQKR